MHYRDQSPLMIYDSDCVICTTAVRFVLKHETEAIIAFSNFESNTFRLLGIDDYDRQTILFIEDGQYHTKSKAVFAIASHFRAPWSWIQYFGLLPTFMTDTIYTVIARNRYRYAGKVGDSCTLTNDIGKRYLH